MSIVYFIQAGKDGPIKIGTTTNLSKRVRAIAQGGPDVITVLASIPGGRSLEARLHRALHESRRRLEWFHPTPEVRALAILAASRGIDPVLRWLEVKERETTVREFDFSPSSDLKSDVRWLLKLAVRHAVERHGIEKVAASIGRSRDRVEAIMRGASMPVECFIQLAVLDPGACAPVFARSGDIPQWIADGMTRDAFEKLLSRIGPKGEARA